MTKHSENTKPSNSTKPVLCNGLRVGNYLKYKNQIKKNLIILHENLIKESKEFLEILKEG